MLTEKKAFTLVEVLVTLGVVGVIAVILMGVIANIIPSREITMLKKAYAHLENVTESLVNNPELYGGDEDYPADGTIGPGDLRYIKDYTSMSQKFCKFAEDMMDTNTHDCSSKTFTTTDGVIWKFSDDGSSITCTVDVNGAKSGGTYTFTIKKDGEIVADDSAKEILKNMYENR